MHGLHQHLVTCSVKEEQGQFTACVHMSLCRQMDTVVHQGDEAEGEARTDRWMLNVHVCAAQSWLWRRKFSQLCVLTLILCPFHPCVTAVARKRLWSFCQKCRWQVTAKHAYTFDPTKLVWADYAIVPEA